jgi:hypothetical protein
LTKQDSIPIPYKSLFFRSFGGIVSRSKEIAATNKRNGLEAYEDYLVLKASQKKISVILDPISSIQKNKTLKQYYLFSYFSFFNSCQYFDKQIPSEKELLQKELKSINWKKSMTHR